MRVVFHIGLHKTGTTYLQQSIFPMLCRQENYLAKGTAQAALKKQILSRSQVNLLSEESWSNSIKVPTQGWQAFEEFVAAAQALEAASKKVILVLRKHEDYLWSSYCHELKMGRKRSISFSDYAASFGDQGLSFFSRIALLNAHFQTLILDYEQLKNSPGTFVARLAEFSEIAYDGSGGDLAIAKPCNLTPVTQVSMLASQGFEKAYQAINIPVRMLGSKPILSEPARIRARDWVIATAQRYGPSGLQTPLPRQELPEDLRAAFRSDWENCWSSPRGRQL